MKKNDKTTNKHKEKWLQKKIDKYKDDPEFQKLYQEMIEEEKEFEDKPTCDVCGDKIDFGFFLNGKLLCVDCYRKEINRG